MPRTIAENAATILRLLADTRGEIRGERIAADTGLAPDEINDAVTILVEN